MPSYTSLRSTKCCGNLPAFKNEITTSQAPRDDTVFFRSFLNVRHFYFLTLLISLFAFDICAKNILVLNASSALGHAIVAQLHEENNVVFQTARNIDHLTLGAKDIPVTLDFAGPMKDLSEKLKGKTLDGIVVITPRPDLGSDYLPTPDAWQKCFDEGFIGPLEALRIAIPQLNKGGKIVIIGGLTSVSALDTHQHFSVLRLMWLGQAKALSRALAKQKIHVNSIALGGTMTDSFKAGVERRAAQNEVDFDTQLSHETDNIPLAQYATPEQVADVVSFFLSSQSNHVTGVNLPMDGGFNRGY